MAGYFVVAALAAIGLLSVLWALLGWLLPAADGCILVCYGSPDEGICSRYRWLRGTGLLRCPLVAVDATEMPPGDDLEECIGEMLTQRLKQERNHGTGTGNFTGCDQRRGISEL